MRSYLVAVGIVTTAHADVAPGPSALPCRPTIACTADFVPPGVVEVELGYLYRRLGDGSNQSTLPFLLKLTLVEWAQLQVGSNGPTFAAAGTYFDDVTAGLKVRVRHQSAHLPAISLSAALSVPTVAATGYVRTYDALITAYATKDLGWLHADWNVGASAWQLSDPKWQLWTALALSTTLGHGFGVMAETYVFSDAGPIATRDAGELAAVSYQPRRWLVLDAGADLGLESTRVGSLFVGMTIIPVVLWGGGI